MHGSSPQEYDHGSTRVLLESAVPTESTLFGPIIDEMSAKRADPNYYDDVYAEFNLIPPQPTYELEPSEGASVSLGQRALALEAITLAISHEHKLSGAKVQANDPASYFSRQYGNDVYNVLEGMKARQYQLDQARKAAIEVLNASTAMQESGFTEEEVDVQRTGIKQELDRLNGTGREANYGRKKIVSRADKSAQRTQQST